MKKNNEEESLKQSIINSEKLFLSNNAQVNLVNILKNPNEPTQKMLELRSLSRLKVKD